MNEYYSSMDQEIGRSSQEMKEIDRSHQVGIDEIGTTTNPFQHQTEALKARIFHGANRVEFAFFGRQKGNKEQPTPETFGKRERRDMRELAEFNKVETTTHATVGVQGLSGLNQGRFSDEARKQAIDEIKRAIHFAAEATTGGAVVFHTGEAPRYMYGKKYMTDEKGNPMFRMFPEEEERRVRYLVDPITKEIVEQVRDVDRIAVPELMMDKGHIKFLKDENNKEIKDDLLKDYDQIFDGKIPLYKYDEDGNIQTKLIEFKDFDDWIKNVYKSQGKPEPTEEEIVKDFSFMKKFLDIQYNLYFSKGSESDYKDMLEKREKVIKALNFYKEMKGKVPEKDWWKYKKSTGPYAHFVPPDVEDPVDYLYDRLNEMDRRLQQSKEMAVHGRRQAEQVLDVIKRAKPAEKFAVEQFSDSMAELGEYVWQKSRESKKKYEKGKPEGIKNDLYLAPENLFPETYGSHPDELRDLVTSAREKMAQRLESNYGMNIKKAKEVAKNHIKATFDIGHANIWRKYFIAEKGESLDQRDKRFNNWLLKETKKLLDEGIIGHIHVSDNFGFHDEHLTAGDGNAPIKEFIEQAKKEGFDEFIVESGSFNPMSSLPDTWMHFDSPVYNIHVPGFSQNTWTDFYRSYFGKTEGPRYIVGDYSPSEEFKGAPFYTGLSME